MRQGLLIATALLATIGPASAQNFFERLFGPPRQPELSPQPQYQPQYRPPPQQRRAPAQQRPASPPKEKEQKAEPAPPVEPPPAPYEKDLLRLAEIMGSLALLRPLCSAPDGSEWQTRMQALLDAEGTTPGRKERLAGAYNKGYQAYALTYRICTASAQDASTRYLREGETLARNISSRYGG
ncbi:TIGR02301 family protein [Microvirga puerhi]|uniref:TIGR02301 family protein n=1 Tax=Microvirga puerhi TaxID=2876078 RepID=A0ABS7VM29_9HYPH|nr:TIGR02301 family protein [Microvirga puerhi]MBZ6076216.1 TIGR02301 family protein [Microvirga puerhi]